ncbi:hypothetical protein KIF59_03440 [Enterobacter cloacae subsp. cloacae]|nr:hypothetical protein [Enterobacter cloacae subsp. cloacae]
MKLSDKQMISITLLRQVRLKLLMQILLFNPAMINGIAPLGSQTQSPDAGETG